MRSERVGLQTVLANIVQMVMKAQRSKAPMQSMADHVAGYFVIAVALAALLTLLIWEYLVRTSGGLMGSSMRAVPRRRDNREIRQSGYVDRCQDRSPDGRQAAV
jgi:cation transport ATPase